jgi:hypothetical protein
VLAALYAMASEKKVDAKVTKKAAEDMDIDPDKLNPLTA